MLKSEILEKLNYKYPNLKSENIENIFDLFIKTIVNSLKDNKNIEIRGFGTITKKVNKEKYVRNPKTNEKLFKNKSFKVHFKIGKTLHKKLNSPLDNEF
tara:strand:+ start:113 stop:409 length:297 start_codon:yes stop_codon:yes gene_type:complete